MMFTHDVKHHLNAYDFWHMMYQNDMNSYDFCTKSSWGGNLSFWGGNDGFFIKLKPLGGNKSLWGGKQSLLGGQLKPLGGQ